MKKILIPVVMLGLGAGCASGPTPLPTELVAQLAGQVVTGVITAVASSGDRFTFDPAGRTVEEIPVRTTASTEITGVGERMGLSALEPGMRARVALERGPDDSLVATRIDIVERE